MKPMFEERLASILEAAIEEFIGSGEPVSSGRLYERYDFGIRPAMIRLELENLSEKGFLEQPHHSAGRVPTDRGYEFFAERALDKQEGGSHKNLHSMLARRAWSDLAGEFSNELGLLGVVGDPEKSLYKEGLDSLVENLDWSDDREIKSVIKDFVEIDERLARIAKKLAPQKEAQVFVGKKSPVTKSENLSVIMKSYASGGERVMVVAIGPKKRMDYRKTLNIFKNL